MITHKEADATIRVTLSPNEAKQVAEICEHAHASMRARAERLDQLGQHAMAVEDRHLADLADQLRRQIGLAISRPVPYGAAPARPDIRPDTDLDGTFRTGELPAILSPDEIAETLGFEPNAPDDPDKVTHSWRFTIDGKPGAIWDYRGNRWSIYDPSGAVARLFQTGPRRLTASRF